LGAAKGVSGKTVAGGEEASTQQEKGGREMQGELHIRSTHQTGGCQNKGEQWAKTCKMEKKKTPLFKSATYRNLTKRKETASEQCSRSQNSHSVRAQIRVDTTRRKLSVRSMLTSSTEDRGYYSGGPAGKGTKKTDQDKELLPA